MRIALCGNPNVGKTTLFNRLTRSNAPTGNWHGVTVESRSKRAAGDKSAVFCDLPGAYSLTAGSKEEEITRDEILFGGYDVYACVAEVNNLRRNLYFFVQLLEADKKVILIVNMLDEARGAVDLELLSKRLGVPVVGTSERMANPRERIISAAHTAFDSKSVSIEYGKAVPLVRSDKLPQPFASLKAAECDEYVCASCGGCSGAAGDRDLPARLRYKYIDSVLDGVISNDGGSAYKRTRILDKTLLGRLALPIFLAVMAAVFVITTEASKPLSALISRFIAFLSAKAAALPLPEWLSRLIAEGVVGGAGAALCFLPQVTILFLLTALLQDCGYMSRVAFLSDGFFKRFGLSGRAAFSLVLGLGCSVTAVMSTRGISDKRVRRRAAFVSPFCPCSARLAVFVAITSQMGISGFAVAGLYILAFCVALAVLAVMKKLDKSAAEQDGFIMEMPPYRLPSARRVLKSVVTSVGDFLLRVGSIVLAVNVIIWLLSNFSVAYGFTGSPENSLMCTFASVISPIFVPLGFGNWRAVTALISGVAAKETIVAVISSLGGMTAVFESRLSAVSFLIFTCLYVPCVATIASLGRESGAKTAVVSVAVHTAAAYVSSLIFYTSAMWYVNDIRLFITVYACAFAALCGAIVYFKIRKRTKHGQKIGV